MRAPTEKLIKAYYDRFNAQDVDGFLDLLADTVRRLAQTRRRG